MPYAAINGQKIHYTDSGGDKPALLFSHGLLMDCSMFDAQVSAFSNAYRCIAWDERGHGGTGDARENFSYYDSAADAAALLAYLGIKQAVFVGMSQGGYLSLRAALTAPHAVRAIVLLGSQADMDAPEKIPGYQAMVDACSTHGLSEEIGSTIEHIIGGPSFDGAPWRAKWKKMSATNLHTIFNTLFTRDDLTDRLSQITAPTLVVHGTDDAAIPLVHAQKAAQGIPGAKLVVIQGGGHAANMTHAAPVNKAIAEFLATLH